VGSGSPGLLVAGFYRRGRLDNIRDAIHEYVSAAQELASEGEVREVSLSI